MSIFRIKHVFKLNFREARLIYSNRSKARVDQSSEPNRFSIQAIYFYSKTHGKYVQPLEH